jgi:hypothetical protein
LFGHGLDIVFLKATGEANSEYFGVRHGKIQF